MSPRSIGQIWDSVFCVSGELLRGLLVVVHHVYDHPRVAVRPRTGHRAVRDVPQLPNVGIVLGRPQHDLSVLTVEPCAPLRDGEFIPPLAARLPGGDPLDTLGGWLARFD